MADKKLYAEEPKKKDEAKEVSLWQDRISVAKNAQDQWARESGADRFIKEYKGDYGINFFARNKAIPIPAINEVFSYVQSDIATTFNRDPYITVNAKAGTVKGAALWEVILNYYWRHLRIKEEFEYEIIDKDLVGYAWHKVGTTTDGSLYSNWLDWKHVLWNIGSKRPPIDCDWMANKIVWPLSKIKETYPAAKGLEGSPSPEVDDDTYKKSMYKDDIKVGVMWEIHNKQKREIYLIAEGLKDKYLTPPRPWPEYQQEFPFLMYWDFAVPGSPRPMSSIAPWEAQILEEMVIMAQAINHAKRWNRQLFVKGGSVDDNALDKFERGDDGAVITVNGNMDESSFRFSDFGPLPTDFYLLMDRLQAIKRNINGQPEFAKGGVTKTNTRTIGELQLMQQGNQSRQGRKIDRLETHCENIARHMMNCLKENFDFEQVVQITGDAPEELIKTLGENYDPVTQSVKFTPEEIDGEYDVDIKAGSTLPMDRQTRIQMMELILQTIAQAAAQGPLSNFMVTLIGELLKDYDIKSLEEAYALDVQQAEQAKQEKSKEQNVQEQKVQMEAAKREAQARQVAADTEITMQEAQLGPIGRAQVERLKNDPLTPKPVANGARN